VHSRKHWCPSVVLPDGWAAGTPGGRTRGDRLQREGRHVPAQPVNPKLARGLLSSDPAPQVRFFFVLPLLTSASLPCRRQIKRQEEGRESRDSTQWRRTRADPEL
jgi:hypothetical protein